MKKRTYLILLDLAICTAYLLCALALIGCLTLSEGSGQRVGISQNIPQRQKHWRSVYPRLYNWTLIKCGLTYRQAQDIENQYLRKGFDGHPGGQPKEGKGYCVYTFQY